ncbi:MAG: formate-dependent nitrite reductase membrane component NrfD [Verrucomicrobiales bacterium]|jgi:formate-dependent nitrite reductase membrane component NrfD
MNAPFGPQIIVYLFLASVAAGSAFVASITLHRSDPDMFFTGRRSLLLAIGAISVGIAFLIYDLVDPMRFLLILTEANPQSAISWGARIVMAFTLVAIFCWALYRDKKSGSATAGECAALWVLRLLALALAIYPGFVLWQGEANALWQTWVIVPLIGFSGLHAGMAASSLLAPKHRQSLPLSLIFIERILLSGMLVFAGFFLLNAGPAKDLIAYLFLAIGVVLPIVIIASCPKTSGILAGLCALVGSVLLRTWLITAGQSLFF